METNLSEFIKIIGKGPRLSRDLKQEEAEKAMDLILTGNATPAQIGAFLIALRIKTESTEETAGALLSLRKNSTRQMLGFSRLLEMAGAHDGKNKSLVLAPFVAMALAQNGIPVLVTGGQNIPTKRGITSGNIAEKWGWPKTRTPEEIKKSLEKNGFAYWDMSDISPSLENLKQLRQSLGLRTILNTIEKLINPAHASHLVTGVYHGVYLKTVSETLQIAGEQNTLCVQASEASTDLHVKKRSLYRKITGGRLGEQEEYEPALWDLKHEQDPPFIEVSADDVVRQVRAALHSKQGLVYDALSYNVAVLVSWMENISDRKSALDKAQQLMDKIKLSI